nr:lecithin retinol acyltransferase family protein [Nocardioides nematodiphilus]
MADPVVRSAARRPMDGHRHGCRRRTHREVHRGCRRPHLRPARAVHPSRHRCRGRHRDPLRGRARPADARRPGGARSPLELFLRGGTLHVRRHPSASVAEPEIVLARAESHLGEGGYRLFRNNCEHFATWCVTGRHTSTQVRIDVASTALAAAGLLVGTTLWARQRA